MQSTNQLLTDREITYAKKWFEIHRVNKKNLWRVYLFIAFFGLPFLFTGDWFCLFGVFLSFTGFICAYFFKKESDRTTFEILPERQVYHGRLTQRYVGSPRYGKYCLFVDDYKMTTPATLDKYLWELLEKYQNQTVKVLLAVCEIRTGDNSDRHYSPLKIENEVCIDSAIKNHGTGFLRKTTRRLYFEALIFILVGCIYFGGVVGLMNLFDLDESLIFFFILLMLPGMYYYERKFIPRNNTDLKEKLKCTCN